MSRHPTASAGKTMLGRYRIERELGRGGMGVVYVATDVNTDRHVALKTTSVAGLGSGEKTRNQRRERFIREVRALTQVNHPNVVHVFDAGEVDDPDLGWLLFYTMEYVEGTTLAALVQEHGALGGGEAAAVVAQVAHGLGEAHRQGIIHRDVKPANIFLSDDGRALIGDFGIAKIEGSTQITRRDQLVGTPNYLAPEQILGEAVGPWTDVFALGALFYVITQNRPLRQQVDAGALLASANGNEPVTRMLSAGGLSEPLKRVVARALERDPTRRYVDGSAFADALSEHATRVPMGQQRPTFLNEGTLDRSSAFLTSTALPNENSDISSLPDAAGDSFAAMGDGDFGSVEAAAMAMLGEVERRSTGTFKQPERKDPGDALPVARTESTVMFNLRALEEVSPRMPSSSSNSSNSSTAGDAGPVSGTHARPDSRSNARAESTLIVKRRAAITMEPVTDEEEADDRDAARGALSGRTDDDAIQPPVSTSGAPQRPNRALTEHTGPTVTAKPLPLPLPVPAPKPTKPPFVWPVLPRAAQLSAVGVVGAILGLVIAVAMAPDDVLAARDATSTTTTTTMTTASRNSLCPERVVGPEEQARALALLDDAKQLNREGGLASQINGKLREALALDPNNLLIVAELSRYVTAKKEIDMVDACICALGPGSNECRTIQKLRQAAP